MIDSGNGVGIQNAYWRAKSGAEDRVDQQITIEYRLTRSSLEFLARSRHNCGQGQPGKISRRVAFQFRRLGQ